MSKDWQPIETLPKQARWVLGWAPGWMVVMMTWAHVETATFKLGPGWYVGDGKYIEPTHWRDLPDPPDFQNSTVSS